MNTLIEDNLTGENHGLEHPNLPLNYLTATSIIGENVFNKQNEKLGVIKDIMVSLGKGKIEYMVIEFGGFLGIGEKYFAIPYELFEVDTRNKVYVLDQKKETLEKAPGFDREHWPETNSHQFQETYTYWGGSLSANPMA
jgi:sporulation protein YlmC with PRC-barrel domain